MSDTALHNQEESALRKRRVKKMIHFCCATCPEALKYSLPWLSWTLRDSRPSQAATDAQGFIYGCGAMPGIPPSQAAPCHLSCNEYPRGLEEIFGQALWDPLPSQRYLPPGTVHLAIKSHVVHPLQIKAY